MQKIIIFSGALGFAPQVLTHLKNPNVSKPHLLSN